MHDSAKAIHPAVRRAWPDVPSHLCELHLYNTAWKHRRADGQSGWGNTYRTLLSKAGQSPEGWVAFTDAVMASPGLGQTQSWVQHWPSR